MVFRQLLQYCKAKAIADSLSPTEESIWREACREYSKTFHTPLHQVASMDMEHVLLNNFEDQLGNMDLEENVENLLEQVYVIENPAYHQDKEDELQSFIKRELDKDKNKTSKKSLPEKEESIKEDLPTGGSVDFSSLKEEED